MPDLPNVSRAHAPLVPFLHHAPTCHTTLIFGAGPCNCGLVAALNADPDDVAYFDQSQFDDLMEYSTSIPTGVFAGKRWKAARGDGWVLCEYVYDPGKPGSMLIVRKPLTIIDRAAQKKDPPDA